MKSILLLIVLFPLCLQAQTIRGKVAAEKDKSPIQFASVGLEHLPDSVVITGVITLTDGGYSFEHIKPGNYVVKVRFVGYAEAKKTVTVHENDKVIEMDTLFLAESAKAIDEVTVVADRLKGKEMVDRTIYSIPPQVAKVSNNGYDILKKIPQVNVDFQNNVTLNGSSNFIIQVDGRERDKEFLAKLLPSDIERVEIISNPSGKYEGNIDGVINVILKKEARYGMNGNLSTYVKPINRPTTVGSASLDYSLGKITFYVTGMIFNQNLDIYSHDKSRFEALDSINNSAGKGKIGVTSTSLNGGFDLYFNDKNSMSLNLNYKPISQKINVNSQANLIKNNNPENILNTHTIQDLKSDEYNASLFYKKNFKNPIQELTNENTLYYFTSDSRNDFMNERYNIDPANLLSTYSHGELDQSKRSYFSSKLDYVQPIGLKARLEAGYQFYYQNMLYNFIISPGELTSNEFQYQEYRNSAYAGITLNLKKIGFQTDLRVEHSHIIADSVSDPNYSCLLPSANLQYKFSASHNIKLTYNRRINRPGVYDLDPYTKMNSNYDLSQGNPDLKPDYRDRLQLTYTWNFGSNYFSPDIYYEILTNKTGQRYMNIQSPVDSSITNFRKPYNLLSGYEYGAGINAMLWFVNINAHIYKGHFDPYKDQSTYIPSRNYFSYTLTSYAFTPLTKNKKTNAYVFVSYSGVNVDAQSKTYSMPIYGFGAQTQIKNHSLGFFYLLPFSKNIDFRRTETSTPYYSDKNTIGFDVSYYIQFMYSYKFNKGKNVKKMSRKTNIESDSKTEGIGR
jgi:hypothetical protein